MRRATSFGLEEVVVNFGMFNFDVHVVFGDEEMMLKWVAILYDDPMIDRATVPGRVRGCCFFKDGCVPVIWLPSPPKTARELATLSHEMLHAVAHMMGWAGIPFREDNHEPYCHALSHGIATVLSAISKPKRGRKRSIK